MNSLTRSQIMQIVNRFIGVSGGYLGDFTYRSHSEFYPEYCDLEIDPEEIEGTTRARFIEIIGNANGPDQAKIVRGVVNRFPVGDDSAPPTRNEGFRTTLEGWAEALEQSSPVGNPTLEDLSAATEASLDEAEELISSTGAPGAVDRIHTALHAYLSELCRRENLDAGSEPSLTQVFAVLRREHPALQPTGPRSNDITTILRSASAIVNSLNPIRNHASRAHPNEVVLDPPEAFLVINIVRSLLHFINLKLNNGNS
jgi:hypothetical protein